MRGRGRMSDLSGFDSLADAMAATTHSEPLQEWAEEMRAAAVAAYRAELRAKVGEDECLPIADFPEDSIDYGEGVCDERNRVLALLADTEAAP
jgi:hypothetical protein